MNIRTLVFDIGRTLLPFDVAPLEPRLAPCRPAALALGRDFEVGAVEPDDFRRRLCEMTGLDDAEFSGWWNSIFEHRWLVPPETLRQLMRSRRSGLISNTNALHMEHLRERFPLLEDFDFQVLSYEVGAAKPEAAIYAAVEREADCRPEEIFYLDDVPEFVEAARRRGWQAEVFSAEAVEGLVRRLRAAG